MTIARAIPFTGLTLLTFAILAAISGLVALDRKVGISDLAQDYVSARSWVEGTPAYLPLPELHERFGLPPPNEAAHVRINPHPPGAVLLTVPLALFDFRTATAVLWWVQVLALALTWSLCFELFRPPVPGWLWAVVGGAFGLWAPVWQGITWGQPSGILALTSIGLWALARAEKSFLFGLALGAATTVRPFFAIQVVLAASWPRREQARAAAGVLLGGLAPFLLIGITPWDWYRVASAAGNYVAECGSVAGVLGLGTAGGQVLFALATLGLAWLRRRGLGLDETAALAAVLAMLTYPLAWFHYDTMLIPVVAWLAIRPEFRGNPAMRWGVVIYLLLRTIPDMMAMPEGSGAAAWLARHQGWVQVAARLILLFSVCTAMRLPAVRTRTPAVECEAVSV